ncbi:MAG: hypothetical protein IJY20_01835 [Clostridia bacterium]|nr:hypothetical protein [Clostridia bacterium]
MRRIIALLLLACMVIPLAACPAATDPSGPSKPGTTPSDKLWQDSIGTYDFQGGELAISVADQFEYELFGEESSQDTLDKLLWERNEALKERFNVELVSVPVHTLGEMDQNAHYDAVQKDLMLSVVEYDLIAMFAYQSGKMITQGYYLDWRSDIPYCRDSIKAGADWWPKGINDDCTVCGHQYVSVSDICITAIEMAWCMAFNKELVDTHNIARKIDNANTMYDIVDSGKWTLQNMYTLLKDFYIPGTNDASREDDLYGLLLHSGTGVDAFAFSLGYHYLQNDAVNPPEMWELTSGVVSTLQTLRNLAQSQGCYYTGVGKLNSYAEQDQFFAERHALFATLTLDQMKTDIIHDMEDKYGVLPYPKLNEAQKKYLTGSQDHYSVLSVPYTNFDFTKVGVVVEALSGYNNLNVNDLYYEAIVTHKNTRDPESVRMIDIIMDGRVYDLTTYHYNELEVSDEPNGAFGLFFRYCVANPTKDIASYWSSCLGFLPEDVEDLINDYAEVAQGIIG